MNRDMNRIARAYVESLIKRATIIQGNVADGSTWVRPMIIDMETDGLIGGVSYAQIVAAQIRRARRA